MTWSALSSAEQLQWRRHLMDEAAEAAHNAYAPFSRLKVGAAVLMNDLKTIRGANVENRSYGLTVCAERVAILSAAAIGYRAGDFAGIAVCALDAGNQPLDITPCGACLQVLAEFVPDHDAFWVLIQGADGMTRPTTLADLFPHPFRL